MSQELFQKYGYCEIPKGTILYRMGEIYEERGATFAFHPRCTMNLTQGSNKLIFAYEIVVNINVLFLVTHLNWNGFPVSGIEELYEAKVEPKDALNCSCQNKTKRKTESFRKNIKRSFYYTN